MAIPSIEDLSTRARAEGFAALGIANTVIPQQNQDQMDAFVAGGTHGTMTWMEGRQAERKDPRALWPQVRSVISLGYSYAPAADPMDRLGSSGLANISAYAWGRDYHDVVKKAAKRLARWLANESGGKVKVFVDTAPVMEKPLAQQAGVGWQGKHTNLVSAAQGSWLFLAEIYTDFDLPVQTPARDQCGSCTRCLDICPTQAMPTPYTLDARRCLAYLSIEHEGSIPTEFRKAMGNRIYGCDDCLAVCPWNKFAQETAETKFLQPEIRDLDLVKALSFDEEGFRAFFSGSPIKRIKWHRWMRNALIVAGNCDGKTWAQLKGLVVAFKGHEDPVLKESAAWAVAQHAT